MEKKRKDTTCVRHNRLKKKNEIEFTCHPVIAISISSATIPSCEVAREFLEVSVLEAGMVVVYSAHHSGPWLIEHQVAFFVRLSHRFAFLR